MKPLIVVFLKWPEPGRVKTRLARTVGSEQACRIYRALVRHVGIALSLCVEEDVAVCYTPRDRETEIRDWLVGGGFMDRPVRHWWPQPDADLGQRQAWAVERAFSEGHDRVALIGTDCIDLDRALFQETWARLEMADWVFGPAADGGYYLGATKSEAAMVPSSVFREVRWSTGYTLQDCLDRIAAQEGIVSLLNTRTDVDEHEDWLSVEDQVKL